MSSNEIRPISEFVKWFMSIEPPKYTNPIEIIYSCHYCFNHSIAVSHDRFLEHAFPPGMHIGAKTAFIESFICLCAGTDNVNPLLKTLDLNSKNESINIVYNPIENPKVEPVSDLSTGGGVNKVHKHDLELGVDQSESIPKQNRGLKPINIVQPTNGRSMRTRRSLDRLNSYVAPTIMLLSDYSIGLFSIIVWTIKYGPMRSL